MTTSIIQLGFPEDSLKYLQEGEKLSRRLEDQKYLLAFYNIIGSYYTFRGDHQQGIEYSEKSFQGSKKIQDVRLMVMKAQGLCGSYSIAGEYQKVVDLSPGVIDVLEKTKKESEFFAGGFNSHSMLCGHCGVSYAYLGHFKEAENICRRGLRIAVEIKHLPSLGYLELQCGHLFAIQGDGNNAIQYF